MRTLADIARRHVGRRHPGHGRAEHRAPLGVGRRTCRRSTRGARRNRGPGPRPGPGRSDRHHGVPGHRHLQARHRVVTGSGRRRCASEWSRAVESDPARRGPADQDERLLQLLRSASHRGPRVLRCEPDRGRLCRARTSRWSSAGSGRENAGVLRSGDRGGAVQARARGDPSASRHRYVDGAGGRTSPSRTFIAARRASARCERATGR